MKPLLITICIAVTLLACYAQNISRSFSRPQPGDSAPIPYRAQRPFDFDQAKAFGGKRNLALSQYVPLYIFSPGAVESGLKKISNLISLISASPKGSGMDAGALVAYVRRQFGIVLTSGGAARLFTVVGCLRSSRGPAAAMLRPSAKTEAGAGNYPRLPDY